MKRFTQATPFGIALLAFALLALLAPALAQSTADNYRDVLNTVKSLGNDTAGTMSWFANVVLPVIFAAAAVGGFLWGLALKAAGNRYWSYYVLGSLIALVLFMIAMPFFRQSIGGYLSGTGGS